MEPLEDDFVLESELEKVEAGLQRAIQDLSAVIDDCAVADETVKAADVKRVLWGIRVELYAQIHRVTGALGEISQDN
ncbi:MAG: hypothetical protein IKH03_02360 [Oscillospiraceae bacterium]|nr:hypothetical protein [Oscillospiraceae bacterium]